MASHMRLANDQAAGLVCTARMGGAMTALGFTWKGRFRPLPRWLGRALRRFVQAPVSLALRGATLGVQALAYDVDGRILLVRQSYTKRWQFPGGGVDRGESLADAVVRELREETNAVCDVPPRLIGIYTNFTVMSRDHVALYVVDRVTCPSFPAPNAEIVAHGFFAPDALPQDTAGSVRRRLAELAGTELISKAW